MTSHLSAPSDERDDLLDRGALLLSWRCDRRGGCDFVSEGWLAFTGRQFDDTLGEGWTQPIHGDDRDYVATARHGRFVAKARSKWRIGCAGRTAPIA